MTAAVKLEVVIREGEDGNLYSGFLNRLSDGTEIISQLNLPAQYLYPGCTLTIEVQDCPVCNRPQTEAIGTKCPCDKHDWLEWAKTRSEQLKVPVPNVSRENQTKADQNTGGQDPS